MIVPRPVVLMLFWIAMLAAMPASAETADYRLGPQDKLQIKVYDWRTGAGEAYQWTALNGEFTVGASGAISLPLLGELPASNGTTSALASIIGERLQAKIGLAQRPDASVQVIKYRPFYIIGAVQKPGDYDYRPELTVLQAVSTAGGMLRAPDDNLFGLERDSLVNRGDLRARAMERFGLLARQARLDAEVKDADSIVFPADLTTRATDADLARMMREEQLIFEARRDSLRSQTDALNQTKLLLSHEVESLAAKDASLLRQLDVTKKELDQVSFLVAKGLAVLPRQLAVEQSSAQFESSRLDVQLATLRTQQDISKTGRDILELHNERRREALREAADVHAKLIEANERIDTAQSLIYQSEVRAPLAMAANGNDRAPLYWLVRRSNGVSETLAAQEGDLVQPGDIVRVDVPRRGTGASQRAMADRNPTTVVGQAGSRLSGF
ncbi:polysaccharide biosynthesis/export family protein [Lichenihabitans psoromatis]|uniref:polysaccharide biosynthesis/export family protein n=1 Tax=Lichenihabitans psoromatis TaxID=2528642 RepID=UPI00103857CE|nr:polysaccharide biosynthesis/export family protein [Lichenihabitans psoromatis]